jgi:hypothetical protein
MQKVKVTGVHIPTPSMSFLATFLNFSKFISSLKAQVCNILKDYVDKHIHKWFLYKFNIFINKRSVNGTKLSPTVPNLPSNDEITQFNGSSEVELLLSSNSSEVELLLCLE